MPQVKSLSNEYLIVLVVDLSLVSNDPKFIYTMYFLKGQRTTNILESALNLHVVSLKES